LTAEPDNCNIVPVDGATTQLNAARGSWQRPPVASALSLRSCLARFATGVTVVTFATPGEPRGITINSFTAVSLEPPLVLISIARAANAHDLLVDKPFCVNVLGAEQEGLARRFAGASNGELPCWAPECGHEIPRLDGSLAFVECEPWRVYDGGDHSLVLGRVVHFDHRQGGALVYLASRFATIAEPELGVEYLI